MDFSKLAKVTDSVQGQDEKVISSSKKLADARRKKYMERKQIEDAKDDLYTQLGGDKYCLLGKANKDFTLFANKDVTENSELKYFAKPGEERSDYKVKAYHIEEGKYFYLRNDFGTLRCNQFDSMKELVNYVHDNVKEEVFTKVFAEDVTEYIEDSQIKDSKEVFNAIKIKDSYKTLKQKIRDEFDETETTEDAIAVALNELDGESSPEEVLSAVIEVLGETIDSLAEDAEPVDDTEPEDDDDIIDDSKKGKKTKSSEKKTQEVSKAVNENWDKIKALEPDVEDMDLKIGDKTVNLVCTEQYEDADYETGKDLKEDQICTYLVASCDGKEEGIWVVLKTDIEMLASMKPRVTKVISKVINS